MKVTSFNANGLRAAARKGFFDWFDQADIDILCVQETKAQTDQLSDSIFQPSTHHVRFRDATTKKGYSGVGIYSRQTPDKIITELGWPQFDEEGRYIEARFGHLSVVSLYLPSGSSKEERQQFKFEVMDWFRPILKQWLNSGRDYIVCGDWNIAHTEMDIKNAKSNEKNSGFLPAERAWMSALIEDDGWVDSYRRLMPDAQDYTWWSQRGRARDNNVGWRIDYQLVTPGLAARLRDCRIDPEPRFSDHAPFTVSFKND